jgi:hypothetical protein
MPGANGSSSAAAASTSSAASNARVWKFQRRTHETLESFYDAVMGAHANGRAQYWKHVVVVRTDDDVLLQCKLCSKQLSARNPADSAEHVFKLFRMDHSRVKKQRIGSTK